MPTSRVLFFFFPPVHLLHFSPVLAQRPPSSHASPRRLFRAPFPKPRKNPMIPTRCIRRNFRRSALCLTPCPWAQSLHASPSRVFCPAASKPRKNPMIPTGCTISVSIFYPCPSVGSVVLIRKPLLPRLVLNPALSPNGSTALVVGAVKSPSRKKTPKGIG